MKNKIQIIAFLFLLFTFGTAAFAQNQDLRPSADNNQTDNLAALISQAEVRRAGFDITATKSPLLSLAGAGSAPTFYLRQTDSWLVRDIPPRTADDQLIKAVRFRAWREGALVRIAVYAITETSLSEKLLDVLNCQLGETKEVMVLKEVGAKPVQISIVKSAELFKGQK